MTKATDIFDNAWDDAFELADELAQTNTHRFERLHRAAMARKAASGAGQGRRQPPPSDTAAMLTTTSAPRTPGVPGLTQHCARRLQQRGIATQDVATVLAYGHEQRSHGADRIFLNRQSRQRLQTERPDLLHRLEHLDLQIVASDDNRIVTVAHRTKCIRRDLQRRWARRGAH